MEFYARALAAGFLLFVGRDVWVALVAQRSTQPHPDLEGASRRLRRVVMVFVGLHAAAVVGLYMLWSAFNYDPPANNEAKAREQMLLALEPDELDSEGLGLIYAGSDAGRPQGQGDFELGHEVRSIRRYSFSGDPGATCQAIVDGLLADGWLLAEHEEGCGDVTHREAYPELEVGPNDLIFVSLTFDCRVFAVDGTLALRMDLLDEVPQEVSLELTTHYPEDSAATTVPDVAPAKACAPK